MSSVLDYFSSLSFHQILNSIIYEFTKKVITPARSLSVGYLMFIMMIVLIIDILFKFRN